MEGNVSARVHYLLLAPLAPNNPLVLVLDFRRDESKCLNKIYELTKGAMV